MVAGAPSPPPLVPVGRGLPAAVTGFAIADDTLYVMTGGRKAKLSAYQLPDGGLRWSVPVSPADLVGASHSGDVVLTLTQRGFNSCCDIVAYDRADGRVRWSRPAVVRDIETSQGLVVLTAGAATQVVDTASGRILWQTDRSPIWQTPGEGYILLTYRDWTVERRALRTGAIQFAGRIPASGGDLFGQAIVDGVLIASYGGDFRTATVTAYDVDTLDLAWARPDLRVAGVRRCGRLVCLRTADGLQAVEPRTGQDAWHRAGWWDGLELGDHLLVVSPGIDEMRAVGVVDPSTGRILLDLRSWEPHLSDRVGRRLLLTRTSATSRRTTVALADLTEFTIDVVGVIPGQVADCQASDGNLACRTLDGRFQLWAYRR